MNIVNSSLNALTFPLTGSHLIEASAGTGKTFTIATLYVRLILGHGNANAFLDGRALTPPEILVVTFTDAATKELRDRIRARLSDAANFFRQDPATINVQDQEKDVLYDLRADYHSSLWSTCARKLQLASEWMDEAAVSTIHGWCNRMLREHAFDSQSLFTQNLETDQTELFSEIVRDYWRNHFYPLGTKDTVQILKFWQTPDQLESAIKPLVKHIAQLTDYPCPNAHLQKVQQDKQDTLNKLKKPWPTWIAEIKILLNDARKQKLFEGKKLKTNDCDNWLNTLEKWATDPALETVDIKTGWTRLTPEGLAEIWKTQQPPHHAAFEAITTLNQTLKQLPDPMQGILCHAAHWIANAFNNAQQQRAQMGFNDLLTKLEAALTGEHGDRLAQVIRQQFPVALIDEFQDTDPVQYQIFERIYEIANNRSDCSLILIGDPKQAIYAFRGADIFTYLKAREAIQGRLYTLNTNFRSTQDMVDAVNHCFNSKEEQPESTGAFLFKQGNHNPVPFQKVSAKGRKNRFIVNNEPVPALMTAVLSSAAGEKKLGKTDAIKQMSALCASQIVAWLNEGQNNRAGFSEPEKPFIAFKPSDIAILVNNVNEAIHIRQALSIRGVRSVYLSDKDSVYASQQATDIYHWLLACADPDDDKLLRAALSTATLGLTFSDLDRLNLDEEILENRILQFKNYREIWRRQGVLPMIRSLLFDFDCVARLLQIPVNSTGVTGERILTDILHLAELLQQSSYALEGEHALIRFLAEQITSPNHDADTQKIRLESDAELVKVVTIFKSKGLEYPVVFLPFIWATRAIKKDDRPIKWHDDNGILQLSLGESDEALSKADHERLGEDIRKAYVALTRARYTTWMGLTSYDNKGSISAIDYLFSIEKNSNTDLLNTVQLFANNQPSITVLSDLISNDEPFTPINKEMMIGKARVLKRVAKEFWSINSYSGLNIATHALDSISSITVTEDTPQVENLREALYEIQTAETVIKVTTEPMHRFYKGAEAGTFLHELMEWVANLGFQKAMEQESVLRETIARRCLIRHWDVWTDVLVDWIQTMICTPLPIANNANNASNTSLLPATLRLSDLKTYQVEMEFWFETHWVDCEQLDAIVTTHTLDNRPRPKLIQGKLNGMLKGFMDLVFEYQGKYYVADYKSNWLGADNSCYSLSNMDEAIRNHRYDLQYVIYLFSLHRLLKCRLPDYDYDTHIGGVIYLFMRGIATETAGVHFERPPKELMNKLDEIFKGNDGRIA